MGIYYDIKILHTALHFAKSAKLKKIFFTYFFFVSFNCADSVQQQLHYHQNNNNDQSKKAIKKYARFLGLRKNLTYTYTTVWWYSTLNRMMVHKTQAILSFATCLACFYLFVVVVVRSINVLNIHPTTCVLGACMWLRYFRFYLMLWIKVRRWDILLWKSFWIFIDFHTKIQVKSLPSLFACVLAVFEEEKITIYPKYAFCCLSSISYIIFLIFLYIYFVIAIVNRQPNIIFIVYYVWCLNMRNFHRSLFNSITSPKRTGKKLNTRGKLKTVKENFFCSLFCHMIYWFSLENFFFAVTLAHTKDDDDGEFYGNIGKRKAATERTRQQQYKTINKIHQYTNDSAKSRCLSNIGKK